MRLLADPPDSFVAAAMGFHQDIYYFASHRGTNIPFEMIQFVEVAERPSLLNYLEKFLGNEAISGADLKALFNRHNSMGKMRAKEVRRILEELRGELRKMLREG